MNHKHFLITLNPLPNRQKKQALNDLISELKRRKLKWRIYETAPNLDTNRSFFERHQGEFTDVIVLGGDGTLNIIANCLHHSNLPIALIPCGTGNDFARTWFNNTATSPIEVALGNKTKSVDLGKCNDHYFINVLGIGFDGELIHNMERSHLKLWRKLTYFLHTLKLFPFYQEKSIELQLDDWRFNQELFIAAFANGKYFGSGMKIAPKADPTNGSLDCCLIGKTNLFKKLYYFSKVFNGSHITADVVQYDTINQAQIITPGLPLQADGEAIGVSPCSISIEPNALLLKC